MILVFIYLLMSQYVEFYYQKKYLYALFSHCFCLFYIYLILLTEYFLIVILIDCAISIFFVISHFSFFIDFRGIIALIAHKKDYQMDFFHQYN